MQAPFKWRHFEAEIILLCIRWYLRYSLSYRDLEEIMLERGLHIDHTTIYRWVQRYAPELEKRCRPHLKTTTDSWRVDETYVKVRRFGACDDSISRMARLKADDLEDDWPTWRRKTKGKVACL